MAGLFGSYVSTKAFRLDYNAVVASIVFTSVISNHCDSPTVSAKE